MRRTCDARLVDKVAEAVAYQNVFEPVWAELQPEERSRYRRMAQAAIDAMREDHSRELLGAWQSGFREGQQF